MPEDNKAPAPQFQIVANTRPAAATAVKFFRIRDFRKYQHYRDRNPPWVKLHGEVLDDYEFQQLPTSARYLFLHLTWLASKTDNKIPNDATWIERRLNADVPVGSDLATLFREGWLEAWRPRPEDAYAPGEQLDLPEAAPAANVSEQAASGDASKTLASCYQLASAETETEAERQQHTEADTGAASAAKLCVCCNKTVISRFTYQDAFVLVRKWKAEGRLVGGRPIENVGGLARTLHQEGTADAEIELLLRPPPPVPKREFTDEPCPSCFGTGMESAPGKGARRCEVCVDEAGKRTGKRPMPARVDDG